MRLYLGLDVGGTKVAAGVVSEDGRVLAQRRVATAGLRTTGDPLPALIRLGQQLQYDAGGGELTAVGIALPGPVDPHAIRMLAAPTIPEFLDRHLGPPLETAFRCPAAGDNDANACALAEARFGAGRGYTHVVYVTVSTGIGGGIVADGGIYRGATGTSAEFGHQVVVPTGGPPCDCGGTGCLEALASGRGIARRARDVLGPDATAETAAERARAGDPAAARVWDDTALYLGAGLANVINILDPQVIVVGGGVGLGAADLLLPRVREVVADRCMPCLGRTVEIVPAALGADLGIIGAAALAFAPTGS